MKNNTFKLRFFKQDGNWYADVPNHSLDDNQMVQGADTFLDMVCPSGKNCTIEFAVSKPDEYLTGFKIDSHNEQGAWYKNIESSHLIWICNVTHDVCGEHPDEIYITKIGS